MDIIPESKTPIVTTNIETKPAQPPKKQPYTALLKVVALPLALIVLIMLAVSYKSQDSLPGTTLYPIKVHFVEPTISLTKLTSDDRSSYNIHRMTSRLEELKVLAQDNATTSPDTLASMGRLIDSYTDDALVALNEDSSLSYEARIRGLSQLTNVSQAQETLIRSRAEFSTIEEVLGNVQSKVTTALETSVQTFASSSDAETVSAFLSEQVQEVGASLNEIAAGSNAQKQAIARIQNANEDIVDGNYPRAIIWILRARQSISVDAFLFDSERGPVEGTVLPDTVIPEGN